MGNLLKDDSEVMVSKSPFSAYQDEMHVYDGRQSPISMEHITLKVKLGNIYGNDFTMLRAISDLEFATSRMVTQYLELMGIDIDQNHVHNRLKAMNKLYIISRFKFVNSEGNTNFRVYCLEKAGKSLLFSRKHESKWQHTDNTRPLEVIKEILARNQLLLAVRSKIDNVGEYRINPNFRLMRSGGYFRPNLEIAFNVGDEKTKRFLFESVRSYDGWKEQLVNKLKCYKEYYENFQPFGDITEPQQIVIIGEDIEHLLEIYKTIFKSKLFFANMEYVYTTDLLTLRESLVKNAFMKLNVNVGKKIVEQEFLEFDYLKHKVVKSSLNI